MLNYLKKFSLEILPSVAATVIGAYIVNHYISRPATDASTAAVVSRADARKNVAAKPANSSNDVASIPERGVTARGISERAMIEKLAAERPAEVKPIESKSAEAKSAEAKSAEAKSAEAKSAEAKSAEAKSTEAKSTEAKSTESKSPESKPTETADQRHHAAPASHEKAVAKATPAAVENAAATPPAEEHRDANDLARAAIERLRNADSQHNMQEASRIPETPRAVASPVIAPPQATAAIRPLPPPITVSTPPVETPAAPAPYTASINNDDPNRPVPPADIPPPPPIDLRAGANKLASHTHDVAQHMLSAARSMFHAVLPNSDADSQQPQQQSSSNSQFTD